MVAGHDRFVGVVDTVAVDVAYTAFDTLGSLLDNYLHYNYCHTADSCLDAAGTLLVDSGNIALEDSVVALASASAFAFVLAPVRVLELVLASA